MGLDLLLTAFGTCLDSGPSDLFRSPAHIGRANLGSWRNMLAWSMREMPDNMPQCFSVWYPRSSSNRGNVSTEGSVPD